MVLFVAVSVQIHAAIERDGVFHDVAVVGNHVERHTGVGHTGIFRSLEFAAAALDFTHQRQFEIT
ncbi:hypothetical protein D3C73_1297920 [compost metagenome]